MSIKCRKLKQSFFQEPDFLKLLSFIRNFIIQLELINLLRKGQKWQLTRITNINRDYLSSFLISHIPQWKIIKLLIYFARIISLIFFKQNCS